MKRFGARSGEPVHSDSADDAQLLLWPETSERSKYADEPSNVCIDPLPRRLAVGDVVAVFALDTSGPSIEGFGTVESHGNTRSHYWIKFAGERVAKHRFVPADWQAEPERSLALLTEFWRSCRQDDPRIEDFFP